MTSKKAWSICRVCLTKSEEMFSIFDEDDARIVTADKIQMCTGITIQQSFDLPEKICQKCLTHLSVSYKFQITCRNSDKILKQYVTMDINNRSLEDYVAEAAKKLESECDTNESVVASEWEPVEYDSDHNIDDKTKLVVMKKVNTKKTRLKKPRIVKTLRKRDSKKIPDSDSADELTTNGKPSLVCDICGNIYKKRKSLEIHLRWHRQEKPFVCELCGMNFGQIMSLKRHMRTHTGEKPFKCQYCDRRFSDYGTKQKHERTHTGERPYSCDVCGKTFVYSNVLSDHKRIHTGEKPFGCDICGTRFARRHHLKAHVNSNIHQRVKKL